MKVATILVPLTEVLSIYRNASLLSGGEKWTLQFLCLFE